MTKTTAKMNAGRGRAGLRRLNGAASVGKTALEGINEPSIKRLARRGGIKRMSGKCYAPVREALHGFMQGVVGDCALLADLARRKTVTATDVVYALKRRGHTLYGYGDPVRHLADPVRGKRRLREVHALPQHIASAVEQYAAATGATPSTRRDAAPQPRRASLWEVAEGELGLAGGGQEGRQQPGMVQRALEAAAAEQEDEEEEQVVEAGAAAAAAAAADEEEEEEEEEERQQATLAAAQADKEQAGGPAAAGEPPVHAVAAPAAESFVPITQARFEEIRPWMSVVAHRLQGVESVLSERELLQVVTKEYACTAAEVQQAVLVLIETDVLMRDGDALYICAA